jgi:hypothetical protein
LAASDAAVSNLPPSERRYDRDEVDRILRTATRMEQDPIVADRDHLTLSEIQEIGSQAGIDPRDIATATLSVALEPATAGGRRTQHVHVVPGELRGAAWDRLVDDLRGGLVGSIVSRSTSALEVEIDKESGELGKLVVSIRSANGVTTVSIWSDAPHLTVTRILSFGLLGAPAALFPVVASAGGQWPSASIVAAIAAAGIAAGTGATVGLQRWARARWQKRVSELLTAIVAKVTRLAVAETLPSGE